MRAISYLIVILLAPTLILLNFRALVFNHDFYKAEFAKLNVYQKFKSEDLVNLQSQQLIKYFCCRGQIDENFFSQREKLHLVDVKNLIRFTNIYVELLLIALLLTTIFLFAKKQIKFLIDGYKLASQVSIAVILFLWVFSKMNFDLVFLKFHYLTFKNDLWQLPADANLLRLFPQQFFVDFANRVAYQTVIMALIIFVSTYLASKISDSQKR